jgi:hypothetical protein
MASGVTVASTTDWTDRPQCRRWPLVATEPADVQRLRSAPVTEIRIAATGPDRDRSHPRAPTAGSARMAVAVLADRPGRGVRVDAAGRATTGALPVRAWCTRPAQYGSASCAGSRRPRPPAARARADEHAMALPRQWTAHPGGLVADATNPQRRGHDQRLQPASPQRTVKRISCRNARRHPAGPATSESPRSFPPASPAGSNDRSPD